LLPFFFLVSIAVLLTSGWPIFFFQKRTGLGKKPFVMIKFRTMVKDAKLKKKPLFKLNEAPWPMFKLRNDPRYTKVGKFLSQAGFDEIPQLFNILLGHMSFVGPRPLPIEEASKLPSSWNFRYLVRPGMTSRWVVSSNRYSSLAGWQKLEKNDLFTSSIIKDLKILFSTFRFVLPNFFKKK
jgi:lipopolysaccharide/colanic/teichoic acid biosynthesis glycosyltransferase